MKNSSSLKPGQYALETIQESHDTTIELVKGLHSSKNLSEDLNKLFKEYYGASDDKRPALRPKLEEKIHHVGIAGELETHYGLIHGLSERYKSLVSGFCDEIIREYSCQSPSEKALAEVIAGSFVRHLQLAESIHAQLSQEYIVKGISGYIAILSKNLDREIRSFQSALILLRQLKSPATEINIKATTAYVAQNQQINQKTKDEIIESK